MGKGGLQRLWCLGLVRAYVTCLAVFGLRRKAAQRIIYKTGVGGIPEKER